MPQMNRVAALGVASSVCRTFAALALKLAKNHQVSDSVKCGLTTEHSVQMESLPLEYYPRKAAVSWEVWSLPRGPWQSLCCAVSPARGEMSLISTLQMFPGLQRQHCLEWAIGYQLFQSCSPLGSLYLIYNVVLISAAHQSDSAIHLHSLFHDG